MKKNCGTVKCSKPNNEPATLKEILKEFSVFEIFGMTVAFLLGCATIIVLTALAYFLLNPPNTM